MDIREMLDWARRSISDYCLNTCEGQCCKNSVISLSENEVGFIANGNRDRLIEAGALTEVGDHYVYKTFVEPCPHFREPSCAAHDSPEMLSTCRQYPLFLRPGDAKYPKGWVEASADCRAVHEKLINHIFEQIARQGTLVLIQK